MKIHQASRLGRAIWIAKSAVHANLFGCTMTYGKSIRLEHSQECIVEQDRVEGHFGGRGVEIDCSVRNPFWFGKSKTAKKHWTKIVAENDLVEMAWERAAHWQEKYEQRHDDWLSLNDQAHAEVLKSLRLQSENDALRTALKNAREHLTVALITPVAQGDAYAFAYRRAAYYTARPVADIIDAALSVGADHTAPASQEAAAVAP